MIPIAPVAKIDDALKLALPAGGSSPQPAVSPEMANKFRDLMQRHDNETVQDAQGRRTDAVAGVLERQQDELSQLQASMQDFVEKASTLSPADRFAAGAAMMQKESLVHMKMSLVMGVTKTSNKSLQTLLKNE